MEDNVLESWYICGSATPILYGRLGEKFYRIGQLPHPNCKKGDTATIGDFTCTLGDPMSIPRGDRE